MSSCSGTQAPEVYRGEPAGHGSAMPPATISPQLSLATSGSLPAAMPARADSPDAAMADAAGLHAPAELLDDGVNGQHHLLRHVLSPKQCSDALCHFGTTDSKAAARMVNRMSQRELRDMFARVYSVHTNSNNNTWLRRKLLEAVGASRRFYAAANRAGRPKGGRRSLAPAGAGARPSPAHTPAGGHASSGSCGTPRAPRPKPLTIATPSPAATSTSPGHAQPSPPQYHHHVLPPGPALPAGSPRALSQRLRSPRHTLGSSAGQDSPAGSPRAAQAAFAPRPSRFFATLYTRPQQWSEEDTCSDGSGVEAAAHHHPRALAPMGMCLDAASPTAAVASTYQPAQAHLPGLASRANSTLYSLGSNASLLSSQFAAVVAPRPAPAPVARETFPLAPTPAASKPPLGLPSINALSALLAAYPAGAAEVPPLPAPQPNDLGLGLLSAFDGSIAGPAPPSLPPPKADACDGGEEWLTWEDCKLPALF